MSSPFPRLLILGHRGAPAEALENTLRSFALSLGMGADGVELDVQRARDGTPVVIHDATLERTFGTRGAIADLDWPAIQRCTGARLPSLQQVAAWAAASGAWLNVELKAEGVEAETLRILDSHGVMDRSFISAFDSRIVAKVGELAPGSIRFLLTETWDAEARTRLATSGAAGVCLRVDAATPATLDALREHAWPVVVWTVDDPLRVQELVGSSVAAIITNRPAEAVAAARVVGRPG